MKRLIRTLLLWSVIGLSGLLAYGLGTLPVEFVLQSNSVVLKIVLGSGVLAFLVEWVNCNTCGGKKQRD